MNNLIIIGNGFDLAHNLKTSYKDFIEHIIKVQIKGEKKYDNLLTIETTLIQDLTGFYEIIESKNYSIYIEFHNEFFKLLVDDLSLRNWCDIEKKYYQELMSMENYKTIEEFHKDFEIIKNYLIDYLENINKKPNIVESYSYLFKRLNKTNLKVLNFNFTNTLSIYIDDNSKSYDLKSEQIINIHGKLNEINNPVIFGYAANVVDSRKLIEKDNKEYLRYIKKQLYKRTGSEGFLKQYIDEIQNINLFFLGHSCGISDELILQQILNHKNIDTIRVFYFENYENYYEIQLNIDRIMNNSDNFEKLKHFNSSSRMSQFGDTSTQKKELEDFIFKVIEDDINRQPVFRDPGVF